MAQGSFCYRGMSLVYLYHPYNQAGQNERSIEIPIARWYLAQYPPPARVLEIGNVLMHYGPVAWMVLEACERAPGVTNADVMTWTPPKPFDFILSISTIEHVGFGKYAQLTASQPTPRDVLQRVRGWLAPGGLLIATVPTGYHPVLDEQFRTGRLGADELHSLRRISDDNRWAECSLEEALAMPYRPGSYHWAGGLVVILCRSEN